MRELLDATETLAVAEGPDVTHPDVTHTVRGEKRAIRAGAQGGMSRRLVLVFAVACGLVVANNYYAQPLLNTLAEFFHTSAGAVGLIVTLAQIGYAAGLVFVVPLGDLVNRRRLIVVVLGATAATLAIAALAPTLHFLLGAALLVGLTSVVAQVLVPFAASLAAERERGKVVGTVMSGLLIGVLLARTVAGLIGQVWGWRAVYGIAAVLTLGLIVVLARELPADDRPRALTAPAYARLLRSVGTLLREEPVLRRRSVYGALTFGAFSVLWTSIAFLLARPPYGYNQAVIGLFGLLGAAGALCASIAGRLADRGWARYATGAFLLAALVAYGLLALGGHTLVALVAGILALDLGVQGAHIFNQSEIYRLRPEARSRLTTAYMTAYFVGGAVGSSTSAIAYGQAGWAGVCLLGAAFLALALLFWLTELLPAVAMSRAGRPVPLGR